MRPQWETSFDLDSVDLQRTELDLGHEIQAATIETQRSKRSGTFGWTGRTLWADEGLRARFNVVLCRQATPPPSKGGTTVRGQRSAAAPTAATSRDYTASGISAEVMASLADRGERLGGLSDQSAALASDAEGFYNLAKQLNKR